MKQAKAILDQTTLNIDLRDLQIFALSSFLLLGLMSQGFDFALNSQTIMVAIFASLCTQYLADLFLKQKETPELISRSALITGLGLCLLLRTNSWEIMAFASVSAVLSKFLIKYRGKHLFNPANFGIITVLCLTDQAWVSPGQWGESFLLALLFISIGGLILTWLGRWETTAVFLLVYGLGIALRNQWLGFGPEIWWHEISSGSLLLFAFFMISDPRSIPDGKWGRIIWSSAIALLTLIFKYQFFLATAPFFALFFLSFFTPIFDYFWQGKRFTWALTTYQLGGNQNETAKL
jgi:Na+-transporting NADH:ubiquinone oxidoreductase subunit NqrB